MYAGIRDGIQRAVYKIVDGPIRLAVRVGVTPNVITTLGLLGNIVAAALFVMAGHEAEPCGMIGWGGAVILLASTMDMVDGRMARLCGMSSVFGAFYDSVLDRYCELFTLFGIAYMFFATGHDVFALATLLSAMGSVMVSYVRARAEGLGVECKVGLMQRPERVVLTSVGAVMCGCLHDCVEFDALWFVAGAQMVIAVLANLTAVYRIWVVWIDLSQRNAC